jgi:hypothetical protein
MEACNYGETCATGAVLEDWRGDRGGDLSCGLPKSTACIMVGERRTMRKFGATIAESAMRNMQTDVMLIQGDEVPIAEVETYYRRIMRAHGRLPRCLRDCANALGIAAQQLQRQAHQAGNPKAAARSLMKRHRRRVI